jgi:hypothetical protein
MSLQTESMPGAGAESLDRLCTSIRGKLQFMDYLVRAAVGDLERFRAEDDTGTRIFLRQLIEMHAANLAAECENMRLLGDLCQSLDTAVNGDSSETGAPARKGGTR